jgi:hypothetical protein
MPEFRRITKQDDPAQIASLAARYEALLAEALAIAQRSAGAKPQLVREILATGTVEGLARPLNSRVAALSYRAGRYKRTWHSLIPWESLDDETPAERAAAIVDMIETSIRMTETDSWPKPRRASKANKRKSRRR